VGPTSPTISGFLRCACESKKRKTKEKEEALTEDGGSDLLTVTV